MSNHHPPIQNRYELLAFVIDNQDRTDRFVKIAVVVLLPVTAVLAGIVAGLLMLGGLPSIVVAGGGLSTLIGGVTFVVRRLRHRR